MVSNEHRALNKDRKLENIRSPWKKFQNLINVGPLIRLWGREKNTKLINAGPMFILDYRVILIVY